MHNRAFARALVIAVLAVAGACKDGSAPRPLGTPRTIRPASPASVSAPVASTLAEPLVARVEDDAGRPVRGVRVLFATAEGMATLNPVSAETDAKGEARTVVTLGPIAGRVDVTAQIVGSDSATRFTITAVALAASRVVVVPDPVRLDGAGQSARLFGNIADQHGNAVGTATITWRAIDPEIATVSSAGRVTGVQAGATARVEARADGFVDTVLVSVADPGTSVCAGTTVLSLAPGEGVVMDPRQGSCVRAAAAAEYVAVPFFASRAPNGQTDELRVIGTGLAGGIVAASAPPAAGAASTIPLPDDAFEHSLRIREERELAPLAGESRAAQAARAGSGAAFAAVPVNASVGDLVTINASPSYSCAFPNDAVRRQDTRTGRVAAITQRAIVVADTSNPPGGFSDADYQRLGVTFDTLVARVVEDAFGAPGDIDHNQRSVIFYTGRVNQISTGSDAYVGGFFWARDLLQRNVCGTSNVAEIFYMLVPDPEGRLGTPRTRSFVEQVTVGTLGHEYQHLINASRRFADPSADPAEVTWLNEGLSHIAEELLFYRTTGLQPRMNIGAERFGGAAFEQRYADYQYNNTVRLQRWLASPTNNSPYGLSGSLATRGAAWAFLRYLADRQPTETDLWFRLANNRASGIANLEQVFKVDILTAAREWAVAMYTDDFAQNPAPEYRFPSWNLRSLFTAVHRVGYPLRTSTLTTNAEQFTSLHGGGAMYYPFRTNAGVDGRVWLTSSAGTPLPPVKVTVVRVR